MGLIVGVFQFCCGLFFVTVIALGGFLGNQFLGENGWLLGSPAGFVVASVALGPLYLLMRIDDNIAALRRHSEASLPAKQRALEPFGTNRVNTSSKLTPRRVAFLVFVALLLTFYIAAVPIRFVFQKG